jgi:hypothetical protein
LELNVRSSPYQGLIPYGEQDRLYFFGRREETAIVAANLRVSPLTVFYGSTGVGKSSVLSAGVVPEMNGEARARRARSKTPDLVAVYCRDWRDDPILAVSTQVQLISAEFGLSIADRTHDLCKLISAANECGMVLALILDQFEEYLYYHSGGNTGALFDRQLAEIVNTPGVRANVLISLREDALARLDQYKGQIHSVFDNYLRIEHLSVAAAREAIVRPIQVFCREQNRALVEVEPELVEAVVQQVQTGRLSFQEKEDHSAAGDEGASRIETPYLQLVMERVWLEEQHQTSGKLRRETLRALGEADTIVRNHLDGILATFSSEDQAIAERLFFHLVTPSGTKVAHTISDLAEFTGSNPADVRRVVERLGGQEHRILRAVPPLHDPSGSPRYEIYHDALSEAIRTWQRKFRAAVLKGQYEEELARQKERRELELQQARHRTRKVMFLLGASFAAVVAFAALAFLTWRATLTAEDQRRYAEDARVKAEGALKLADERLRTIETLNRGQLIREAALSNDRERLSSLISSLESDTPIRFGAEAQDLKYRNPAGQEVYQFSLFPVPSTLPGGRESVAFVTYLADHPTFKNTLMTAAAGRGYRATYIGWGCLSRIVAVIEYSDHTRAPSVKEFDMCALLGWR